ncbi:hypothetical protein EMCRGX_G026083 [Ephydatia muelleri]
MCESDESLRLSRVDVDQADDEVLETSNNELFSSIRLNREHATGVLNGTLATVLHFSPWKQVTVGFGVGWISGYLFRKVSRTAAIVIGGTFVAVQVAVALGLIEVNWGSLKRAARQNIKHVENKVSQIVSTQDQPITDFVMHLCTQHVYLTSGFGTGVFSGFIGFPL